MKKYAVSTPKGTRDIFYNDCKVKREIERGFAKLFESRGYTEIITPVLEYYDLMLRTGNPVTQEELYKLTDRDGRLLVLRPDMTTPISRVAATRLSQDSLPERFYYIQDVFLASTQTTQAGIEILGAAGIKADIEAILIALEALSKVSSRFRIEIGHAGFFRALADSFEMDADFTETLRKLVETKNFAAINDMLSRYRKLPACEALCRLPQLFGGEEVLREAVKLSRDVGGKEEIEYLGEILSELGRAGYGDNVMLDLGLVRHMDYYTGVVFQGYVQGVGSKVLGGGRYDSLAENFGRQVAATGFAVDVDSLLGLVDAAQDSDVRYVLHVEDGYYKSATDFMDKHKPGQCEMSPYSSSEASAELARLRRNCKLVIINGLGCSITEVQ